VDPLAKTPSLSGVIPSYETQFRTVFGLPSPLPLPSLAPSFSRTPSPSIEIHHDRRQSSESESARHVSTSIKAVPEYSQDPVINSLQIGFPNFGQYIDPTNISISQWLPPIPVECMIDGTFERTRPNENPAHDVAGARGYLQEPVTKTSTTPPKLLPNNSQGLQQRQRNQDLDEAEEPEDNGSSKKPRAYLVGESVSAKFACPSYKRDPKRYGPWEKLRYRPCIGPGSPEFRRLR
jgi:hypothetical protein